MPLTLQKTVSEVTPIAEGDAGIVIKPNGDVQMFNLFGAAKESDYTREQIETGKRLLALIVALKTPQIMTILEAMAQDPDVVGATAH